MSQTRTLTTANVLPDGTMLIGGGFDGSNMVHTAEIFEPTTGIFVELQAMATAGCQHTATILGRVLFVGGSGASSTLTQAELFDAI